MMGNYIAIEMNGQKVGLKFGLYALQQVIQKEKEVPFYGTYPSEEDPTQMVTTWSELAYAHIMYAGYCNNQYLKNEPVTIPFETFYNFAEEAVINGKDKALAILKPIISCFTSHQLFKEHIESQGKINEPAATRAESPKKKYK